MTDKLFPCPFCGGDASLETGVTADVGGSEIRYVTCVDCSAQADPHDWQTRPSPETNTRAYPQELTDDLRDILSLMMWNTGPMAHALRAGGQDIKHKAEEEQAEVMHWLIGLALEHGSEWRAKASDRIREIKAALATTEGQDNG